MPRRDPTVIWNGFLEIVKLSLCLSFSGSLHLTQQTLDSDSHGSWDQIPDLERLMIWARRESRRLCWCWKVAMAKELEVGVSGSWAAGGGTASSFVFAKQIKHLPANRGLWLDSKSLPHSETDPMLGASLSKCCLFL